MAWLKLNEIRSVIQMGDFNKRSHFRKGGQGSLQQNIFTTDKGSWKFLQKFNEITKIIIKNWSIRLLISIGWASIHKTNSTIMLLEGCKSSRRVG
jgi:hypothetical protein